MLRIENTSRRTIVRHLLSLLCLFSCFGLSAQTVTWQVRPKYEEVKVAGENLIVVKSNGRYGIVAFDGSVVAECRYDRITPFVNGYALLLRGDLLSGNVTEDGKVTLFNEMYSVDMDNPYYSEGLLAVKRNGRWGYIDVNGRFVIAPEYINAYPYSHGLAAVRDAKGYFMHIGRSGRISYLASGFNDENLIFASSFNDDGKGNAVAVVITNKGKAYQRDLAGNRVESFYPISGITSISRDMTVGKYRLVFDTSLKLASFHVGASKMVYETSGNRQDEYSSPVVHDLHSVSGPNGKFDLSVKGTQWLTAQFDTVSPLTSDYVLASFNGLYGILKLMYDGIADISFQKTELQLSHWQPVRCRADISLPPSAGLRDFAVIGIRDESGNEIKYDWSGAGLDFSFTPETLSSRSEKRFRIRYTISGIEYPYMDRDIAVVWKPAFKVEMTSSAALDSLGVAQLQLKVTNVSDIPSAECTIYVNGRKFRTVRSFSPRQTVSLSLNESVGMEDEDFVDRNYRVVISERNCPDMEVARRVRFERYYKNDEDNEN